MAHGDARIATLPRRLFRKIAIEQVAGGWRARIVGFDAKFYTPVVSRDYPTRDEAVRSAMAASRAWGLPVITAETLAATGEPGEAA